MGILDSISLSTWSMSNYFKLRGLLDLLGLKYEEGGKSKELGALAPGPGVLLKIKVPNGKIICVETYPAIVWGSTDELISWVAYEEGNRPDGKFESKKYRLTQEPRRRGLSFWELVG